MTHWLGNLQQSTFQGINNITINYCVMAQSHPSPAIIMVSGRSESYLKYQALINEFYQMGYSVYMHDHRGQGLSQRLLTDPHKGYVEKFSYYVDDLALFIDSIVMPAQHTNHVMFGHSMGGLITTRYLQTIQQDVPNKIDKVILSSPMHGVLLPAPKIVVECIMNVVMWFDRLLQREPSYTLGGTSYRELAFDKNELTQDIVRYETFRKLYRENTQLQLGSPTFSWLKTSLDTCLQSITDVNPILTPILLLQAAEDTIVDNNAQNEFVVNMEPELITKVDIAGARHELFFEVDNIRTQAMTQVRTFLSNDGV